MRYFFTLFAWLLLIDTNAQTISGIVISSEGSPLMAASITLRTVHSKTIRNFTTTDSDGKFVLNFPTGSDSLQIRFSYLGFNDEIVNLPIERKDIELKILLDKAVQQLEEVKIDSRATWKNGDTSFFKVEAYKDGNEKKLDDVVDKLPGFSRDEQNRLIYKGKIVEKITVDGEDIFADKVNLLLKNIPVNSIQNIQSLENQTDKPLLKGLDGSKKVFLNLELKKEKIKSQIGDWEAGLNTKGGYVGNFVSFSLYSKTKLALIGNFNSIGNGIGFSSEQEFKSRPAVNSEKWMSSYQNLNLIEGLPNRYYINNKQFDTRLKIITPINKKVIVHSEWNFLTDDQCQTTLAEELIISDTFILKRSSNINYKLIPSLLQIKESLKINFSHSKQLNIIATLYGNYSRGISLKNITDQSGSDTLINNLKNNFQQLTLLAGYTFRKSSSSAIDFELLFTYGSFIQKDISYSKAYPQIFQIPASEYFSLNSPSIFKQSSIEGMIRYLTSKRRRISNSGLNFHFDSYQYSLQTYLSSTLSNKKIIEDFSGNNEFLNFGITTNFSYIIPVLKSDLSLKIGYEAYIRNDSIEKKRSYNFPVYNLTLKRVLSTGKNKTDIAISTFNSIPDVFKFRNFYLPNFTNNYILFKNNNNQSHRIEFRLNYSGWIKRHYFFLSPSLTYSSSGYAFNYFQTSILSKTIETSIVVPNYSAGINLNYSHASVPLRMLFNFFIYGSTASKIYLNENLPHKYTSNFIYSNLSLKKNWKRKYFLESKSNLTVTSSKIPIQTNKSFNNTVVSFNSSIIQKYILKNSTNFRLEAGYFNNDALGKEKKSFFYIDAEVQFEIPRIPFQFTINLQNITNQQYLSNNNIEPFYQSIYTMPLVERNLLFRIRYEL